MNEIFKDIMFLANFKIKLASQHHLEMFNSLTKERTLGNKFMYDI